jgi:hypothetical protein
MGAHLIFLTCAAEGFDRRGFTLEEIEKMIAAGVIDPDEADVEPTFRDQRLRRRGV